MGSAATPNTKEQLLDVTERAIAERGYAGTTLRSIASAAGANIAAVHYHFGSKEELFRAVVARMARPIVARELALLGELQQQTDSPSVEAILRAFLRPPLEFVAADDRSQCARAQFMGRCRVEPEPIQSIASQEFAPSTQAFLNALQKALPEQSRSQLTWKLDLVIASLIRVMTEVDKPEALLQSGHASDIEKTLTPLVAFLAAGLRS